MISTSKNNGFNVEISRETMLKAAKNFINNQILYSKEYNINKLDLLNTTQKTLEEHNLSIKDFNDEISDLVLDGFGTYYFSEMVEKAKTYGIKLNEEKINDLINDACENLNKYDIQEAFYIYEFCKSQNIGGSSYDFLIKKIDNYLDKLIDWPRPNEFENLIKNINKNGLKIEDSRLGEIAISILNDSNATYSALKFCEFLEENNIKIDKQEMENQCIRLLNNGARESHLINDVRNVVSIADIYGIDIDMSELNEEALYGFYLYDKPCGETTLEKIRNMLPYTKGESKKFIETIVEHLETGKDLSNEELIVTSEVAQNAAQKLLNQSNYAHAVHYMGRKCAFINSYLYDRTKGWSDDIETISGDKVFYYTLEDAFNNVEFQDEYIDREEAEKRIHESIRQNDEQMKPCPFKTKVRREISHGELGFLLDMDKDVLKLIVDILKGEEYNFDDVSVDDLINVIRDNGRMQWDNNSFQSTTWFSGNMRNNKSTIFQRGIIIEYNIHPGTDVYFTGNESEGETLLGRGCKCELDPSKIYWNEETEQLVLVVDAYKGEREKLEDIIKEHEKSEEQDVKEQEEPKENPHDLLKKLLNNINNDSLDIDINELIKKYILIKQKYEMMKKLKQIREKYRFNNRTNFN